MDPESAVTEYVTIMELQKTNSTKQKTINGRKEASKAAIIERMQRENLTYIQGGDNCFLTLQTKTSSQAFTPEFLNVLYRAFNQSQMGRNVPEDEGMAFATFCKTQSKRLGNTHVDLVPSKSRPLAVMLADMS